MKREEREEGKEVRRRNEKERKTDRWMGRMDRKRKGQVLETKMRFTQQKEEVREDRRQQQKKKMMKKNRREGGLT
jgi:hypothetical protein